MTAATTPTSGWRRNEKKRRTGANIETPGYGMCVGE